MGKSRIELGRYRLFDAREKLRGAEVLLRNSLFKESVARSYYAMFSAVRALLAMEDLDSQKHSGVISLFNKHFVKSGIRPMLSPFCKGSFLNMLLFELSKYRY